MNRPIPQFLREKLSAPRPILLGTHEHPDADGLGSLFAFGLVLQKEGFEVARVSSDAIPSAVAALPGSDRVPLADPEHAFDVGILFDCHEPSRLGRDVDLFRRAAWTTCIDHHPPRGESELSEPWIVDDAPATAILVLDLVRALFGVEAVTPEVATCLYAGLITDTGGFRHENTTSEALADGAFLVERGADPAALAEALLHRRRAEGFDLLARVLSRVELGAGGRVATAIVDPQLLAETGARPDEIEGIVGHLGSIEGVRVAALVKPDGDGRWRVSLRANGPCAVDDLAREFGGGGHRRAAAFATHEPLEQLWPRLLRRLESRARECAGEA